MLSFVRQQRGEACPPSWSCRDHFPPLPFASYIATASRVFFEWPTGPRRARPERCCRLAALLRSFTWASQRNRAPRSRSRRWPRGLISMPMRFRLAPVLGVRRDRPHPGDLKGAARTRSGSSSSLVRSCRTIPGVEDVLARRCRRLRAKSRSDRASGGCDTPSAATLQSTVDELYTRRLRARQGHVDR